MKRMILMGLAALALVFSLSACTPAQVRAYMNAFNYWNRYAGAASPGQLASLRNCESGGNYRAVSPNGRYRGAYQFDQRTWNSVASRHYPHLVGKDPIRVAPYQQDAMALALISERGFRPWPNCG